MSADLCACMCLYRLQNSYVRLYAFQNLYAPLYVCSQTHMCACMSSKTHKNPQAKDWLTLMELTSCQNGETALHPRSDHGANPIPSQGEWCRGVGYSGGEGQLGGV